MKKLKILIFMLSLLLLLCLICCFIIKDYMTILRTLSYFIGTFIGIKIIDLLGVDYE